MNASETLVFMVGYVETPMAPMFVNVQSSTQAKIVN